MKGQKRKSAPHSNRPKKKPKFYNMMNNIKFENKPSNCDNIMQSQSNNDPPHTINIVGNIHTKSKKRKTVQPTEQEIEIGECDLTPNVSTTSRTSLYHKAKRKSLHETDTSSRDSECDINPRGKQSAVSSNWKNLQKKICKNKPIAGPVQRKVASNKKPKVGRTEEPDSGEEDEETAEGDTLDSNTPAQDDGVWFDDVDDFLLDASDNREKTLDSGGDKNASDGLTPCVAMDCEMVGVGFSGKESMLARVSIVNQYGKCLLDKYVKPREDVSDYRTHVSGITPQLVSKAYEFSAIQKEVCDILEGRILVGHAIKNDLKVLFLSHPRKMIRDTSQYRPFRRLFSGKTPSLKALAKQLLGVPIQDGQHNSVEDAQAAMKLYILSRKNWEQRRKTNISIQKARKT